MSDVRERLVEAISPMCRDQWWELNRPGEVTAREHAEVIVNRLLDVLSAEQASPERVERAAEAVRGVEAELLGMPSVNELAGYGFARAALAAAGPVVVVRDSEERLCERCGNPVGFGGHGPGFCLDRRDDVRDSEERLTEAESECSRCGGKREIEVPHPSGYEEYGSVYAPCPHCGGASVSPSPSSPAPSAEERERDEIEDALEFARAPTESGSVTLSPAGRIRALYGRERIDANRQRARVSELEKALEEIRDRTRQDQPALGAAERAHHVARRALLSDTEGGEHHCGYEDAARVALRRAEDAEGGPHA